MGKANDRPLTYADEVPVEKWYVDVPITIEDVLGGSNCRGTSSWEEFEELTGYSEEAWKAEQRALFHRTRLQRLSSRLP